MRLEQRLTLQEDEPELVATSNLKKSKQSSEAEVEKEKRVTDAEKPVPV